MRYEVAIPEISYVYIEVDASSEEEAKRIAARKFGELDEINPIWSHQLGMDQWEVEEMRKICN